MPYELSKQKSTEYIKKKWGKEGKVLITLESWENICRLQCLSPGLNTELVTFMSFGPDKW